MNIYVNKSDHFITLGLSSTSAAILGRIFPLPNPNSNSIFNLSRTMSLFHADMIGIVLGGLLSNL